MVRAEEREEASSLFLATSTRRCALQSDRAPRFIYLFSCLLINISEHYAWDAPVTLNMGGGSPPSPVISHQVMRSESWKKETVHQGRAANPSHHLHLNYHYHLPLPSPPPPPPPSGICEGTAGVSALTASRRGGNNGYVTTAGAEGPAEAKGAKTFVMEESGGGGGSGAQTDRQTEDIHECKAAESRPRMLMSDINLV